MTLFYIIIISEYLLVALIGIYLCFFKLIIDYREKKIITYINNFKILLKSIILKKKTLEDIYLQYKNIAPNILIMAMEAIEISINTENWIDLKNQLRERYLEHWIIKAAKSPFWSKRNLAARTFLLCPKETDLPYLIRLLNDRSFFIRIQAVAAMTKIASDQVIEILLQKMSTESFLAKAPYRQAFRKMTLEALMHIIAVYQKSDNENIRLACLDIMSLRFIGNSLHAIKKDYHSQNGEIRKYIVKILGNLASEEAIFDLLHFLQDPDYTVRVETIHSLGKIQSENSFEMIKEMLHDKEYQVRLQAALTLVKFGEKGIRALQIQDWDIDPRAYEVARYVLTMP